MIHQSISGNQKGSALARRKQILHEPNTKTFPSLPHRIPDRQNTENSKHSHRNKTQNLAN